MSFTTRSTAARAAIALLIAACSGDGEAGSPDSGGSGTGGGSGSGGGASGGGSETSFVGVGSGGGPQDRCLEDDKSVFLVSVENDLWRFQPDTPGLEAYERVGTLDCPSASSPQSMAVSRHGSAYVFYSDGQLFRVSTADASCQATEYVHPGLDGGFQQLGMGFTATEHSVFQEVLYIVSPRFGIATVAVDDGWGVTELGALTATAELTGGPDARLFHFQADQALLSEVNRDTLVTTPLRELSGVEGASAFAFSRYAGVFYVFTAVGAGSTCTAFDPVAGTETVRDANLGFTVVGAGQSICVPPPPAPN